MMANPRSEKTEVYTVKEAAIILGISLPFAYNLVRKGELPGGLKLGGRFIVSKRVLHKYVNGEIE